MPDYLHPLLLVYTAYFIAVASPGPSTLSIISVAMTQGRMSAIALALGVVSGIVFWASLAASGISALLTAYAEAVFIVKIVGGCYLLYLAWKSARSALSRPDQAGARLPQAKHAQLYRRGVMIHLTNPKAVLGWIAILSLGLGPNAQSHSLSAILLGCVSIGFVVNIGYAILFSTSPMARAYRKARPMIEGGLAVIFTYAGLRLLLSRS